MRECMAFIEGFVDQYGVAPSFSEIQTGMGLQSRSGVHKRLTLLEERGFIRRVPNRARGIEIVRRLSSIMTREGTFSYEQKAAFLRDFIHDHKAVTDDLVEWGDMPAEDAKAEIAILEDILADYEH